MNSFMERIQTKVEGIKNVYECASILIKEDTNTGICKAYYSQKVEKINNNEIKEILTNIEDDRDMISYKILFLPAGRVKRINEQEGSYLYTFCSLTRAISGEYLFGGEIVTKDKINELISLYQSQKQSMKYTNLKQVRIKGKVTYIGEYIENGVIKSEELFGNVISNVDINNIEESKVIVDNSYLQDFKSENNSLKFTTKAIQTIIDRNRALESR